MLKQMFKIILFLLILLLINLLSPAYTNILNIVLSNLTNVFIGAGIAYISYPLVVKLKQLGVNTVISNIITILVFFSLFIAIGLLVLPLLYSHVIKLIELIQHSSTSLSWIDDYPQVKEIYNYIEPYFDKIAQSILNWIASETSSIVGTSTKLITDAFIIVCLYIYILIDAPRIIKYIKRKLGYNTKRYKFVQELDDQLRLYIKSVALIIAITVVEYAIVYSLIGHPDWRTLAALCAIANLIPYFGGIIVNIIALITAAFVSQELFLKVLACVLILPNIEGNVINPIIHKKRTNISPIIVLPSLFIGSGILGFMGIVITLPILICIKVFYKYYAKDVKNFINYVYAS
ncbi:AI-2E family transporter [Mycoplasma sp. P36-A1]|uniref:AI-2E family transporter n=1 Tax=Mycoplasma sp. P36-A1 TaxID=3252900 RepID=UPI003C2D93AB